MSDGSYTRSAAVEAEIAKRKEQEALTEGDKHKAETVSARVAKMAAKTGHAGFATANLGAAIASAAGARNEHGMIDVKKVAKDAGK
jgi:hypothetical protein